MGGCVGASNKTKGEKIIMIGLKNSGKTTLYHYIVYNNKVKPATTIGNNRNPFEISNVTYNLIEFGSCNFQFPQNRIYFLSTNSIIFVIDGLDKEQLKQAADLFRQALSETELMNKPILIFINKYQKDKCITEQQVIDQFKLNQIVNVEWKIQQCNSITDQGVKEGLKWIHDQSIPKQPQQKV